MSMIVRCMALVLVLLACGACMKQEPVKYYVIHGAGGVGTAITDSDADKLRATLDAFAARYKLAKVKSGELNIIRLYQASANYQIGFFAKRTQNRIAVYANPLTPGESREESYKAFRQNLATVLSQAFPGRVTIEVRK